MTISEQEIRQALAERAGSAEGVFGMPALDVGAMARAVATSPHGGPRAARSIWWFRESPTARILASGGLVVIAVALIVSLAVGPLTRTPGTASAEPGASASSVHSALTASPDPTETSSAAGVSSSLPVTGCDTLGFSVTRCAAVVALAREQAEPPLAVEDVIGATIGPPPAPDVSLGSFPIADVELALVDGGTSEVVVRCLGIPGTSDRACNPEARIHVVGGVDQDVPCGAEPGGPDNPCATLPPTARPASIDAAEPLRVASLDIPLDHVGHYEVLVGAATLADGVLSERSARLVDDHPTTFWIDDGVVLEVLPADPERPPIGSIYRDPFDGPESVTVRLVFDIAELSPGAVLQVRGIVVR